MTGNPGLYYGKLHYLFVQDHSLERPIRPKLLITRPGRERLISHLARLL